MMGLTLSPPSDGEGDWEGVVMGSEKWGERKKKTRKGNRKSGRTKEGEGESRIREES